MRKKVLVAIVLSMVILLTSCGMGWQNFKKDFKSDLGGGLDRTIVVSNMLTGEVIWEHSGVSYINDKSTSGDITVVYRDRNGASRKADFIGIFYGIHTFEN